MQSNARGEWLDVYFLLLYLHEILIDVAVVMIFFQITLRRV